MNDLFSPHAGYRKLRSFQSARIVYDGTVIFCNKFIDKRSRTHDQMVQAARSGGQNIAEGSMASATSKKIELKLTGVARASLSELLLDFEDYLRQNGLKQWGKDSREALAVRGKYKTNPENCADSPSESDIYGFSKLSAVELSNTMICLINQASFLLWRQMEALEQEFIAQRGFTERMFQTRKRARDV